LLKLSAVPYQGWLTLTPSMHPAGACSRCSGTANGCGSSQSAGIPNSSMDAEESRAHRARGQWVEPYGFAICASSTCVCGSGTASVCLSSTAAVVV
jgi:hypothetical protein